MTKEKYKDRRAWILPAIKHHCKHEENWYLNRKQRFFLTIKAIIVLIIGRHNDSFDYSQDYIEVAHGSYLKTYHPEFGEGASWDYFAVGKGLLKEWWYYIGSTGYP